MWHDTVLKADSAFGRLLLGFLNTCTDHPVLTIGFLAVMMVLAMMMCVDAVRTEHKPEAPQPIRLHR